MSLYSYFRISKPSKEKVPAEQVEDARKFFYEQLAQQKSLGAGLGTPTPNLSAL